MTYMNRRDFLKTIGFVTTSLSFASCTHGSQAQTGMQNKKPNIVLIFIDDLGYADVGYHGCKDIPTPNIDSIAKKGAQFSAAYVTAPVCGPSRAGLLTGRYQQRFGFEDNPGPFRQTPETKIGIPETEKTIGDRMKAIGYKTAFIGKHHSGKKLENNPINKGFDYYFGFDNGASNYFIGDNKKGVLKRGLSPVKHENDYLTDAFGREAVSFIERNKSNPFFLYFPINAVHGPMQAPEALIKKYDHIQNEGRRKLAAMLHSADENIGRIIRKLKSSNLEDNTMIIFVSDNGGAEERSNFSYNKPCRDAKGTMYDGGIRVPFCIQWKKNIPAGQKIDFPINTLDITPTCIAAAGKQIQDSWQLDGIDLLPYLTGKDTSPKNRYLYWRFLFGWAIRDNEWKLVKPKRKGDPDRTGKPELYRIASDIGEKNNLIDKHPEVANKLQKAWDRWDESMIDAQWGWQPAFCGKHRIPLD